MILRKKFDLIIAREINAPHEVNCDCVAMWFEWYNLTSPNFRFMFYEWFVVLLRHQQQSLKSEDLIKLTKNEITETDFNIHDHFHWSRYWLLKVKRNLGQTRPGLLQANFKYKWKTAQTRAVSNVDVLKTCMIFRFAIPMRRTNAYTCYLIFRCR